MQVKSNAELKMPKIKALPICFAVYTFAALFVYMIKVESVNGFVWGTVALDFAIYTLWMVLMSFLVVRYMATGKNLFWKSIPIMSFILFAIPILFGHSYLGFGVWGFVLCVFSGTLALLVVVVFGAYLSFTKDGVIVREYPMRKLFAKTEIFLPWSDINSVVLEKVVQRHIGGLREGIPLMKFTFKQNAVIPVQVIKSCLSMTFFRFYNKRIDNNDPQQNIFSKPYQILDLSLAPQGAYINFYDLVKRQRKQIEEFIDRITTDPSLAPININKEDLRQFVVELKSIKNYPY